MYLTESKVWFEEEKTAETAVARHVLTRIADKIIKQISTEPLNLIGIPQYSLSPLELGLYLDELAKQQFLGGGKEGVIIAAGIVPDQDSLNVSNSVGQVTKLLWHAGVNEFLIKAATQNPERLTYKGRMQLNNTIHGRLPDDEIPFYDQIAWHHKLQQLHPGLIAPISGIVRAEGRIAGYQLPSYQGDWACYADLTAEQKSALAPILRYVDTTDEGDVLVLPSGDPLIVDPIKPIR